MNLYTSLTLGLGAVMLAAAPVGHSHQVSIYTPRPDFKEWVRFDFPEVNKHSVDALGVKVPEQCKILDHKNFQYYGYRGDASWRNFDVVENQGRWLMFYFGKFKTERDVAGQRGTVLVSCEGVERSQDMFIHVATSGKHGRDIGYKRIPLKEAASATVKTIIELNVPPNDCTHEVIATIDQGAGPHARLSVVESMTEEGKNGPKISFKFRDGRLLVEGCDTGIAGMTRAFRTVMIQIP